MHFQPNTEKYLNPLLIQKCCNEDEVLNNLRVCVKPGSGNVPMLNLRHQENKNEAVRKFIKQKFSNFHNKHTNEMRGIRNLPLKYFKISISIFINILQKEQLPIVLLLSIDISFNSLRGKFCDQQGIENEIVDWFYTEKESTICSDLIVYEISPWSRKIKNQDETRPKWHSKPITVKCKNDAHECSNSEGTICVPKCCPHNRALIISQNGGTKCVRLNPDTKYTQTLSIPIRSTTISECAPYNTTQR